MGGDYRRLPHLQFNWQSPNLNPLGAPLDIGQQNPMSAGIYPGTNMTPMRGTLPVYASSKLPHSWVGQANEPHGWFHCLPRFRQSFTPALNQSIAVCQGRLPTNPYESCREAIPLNAGSGCVQKKFAAVDKLRDQTTLIFSSGIGTPVQCLTSWGPKPHADSKLNGEDVGINGDFNYFSGPILTDEINENLGTDVQSEMHEDTEELNALLYSDDSSEYTEDGEVTSTGHSPCTMTAHDKKDWLGGSIEEVASSAGPTKKRKQLDTVYDDAPSLMDTASSMNHNRLFECEGDAESSCANGNNAGPGEMGSLSGTKRMKKDRIRETVNILQSIIPGASGKDAIVVLDETIRYLKSLKLRAMALGLDAL
ncbi:transcription factor bHLH145-like [Carya illinoinensis]|uniref:transcription factor bHLH145-like n=1 Tax=Carya illinoinensis TaxID=32201 RepID=UPI001C723DE4|nr:transcription factor bHLH145-like [Carya illinoinensis]